ncbi:MAG TPA: M20 family metallopeptidase [Synergistaceae bacterium]|nr:M20 family metallopeptidase [Synergistaceae bacterium]
MDKRYEELWSRVEKAIETHWNEASEISDFMAAHPELGDEEYQASAKHAAFLAARGYEVEKPFCRRETAYRGVTGSSEEPRVVLLAEYDALPEIGHACGHNVHGAMVLLAAAGLREIVDSVPCRIEVVGTPAEETNGAKVVMAEEGVFDGASLALMIHTGAGQNFVDYSCLAMDAMEFTFSGKPAHAAAAPWEGRNALNGVQLFFHAVDMLRQHLRPEVRMHGIVTDGGNAANIVPDRGICRFYFRAPQREYLDTLMEKIYNCARGAALATETEVSWQKYEISFDNLRKNPPGIALLEGIYREEGVALTPPPKSCGSSDVGNVGQRCPALQPVLGVVDDLIAAHTREYAAFCGPTPEAHEAIRKGARILAKAMLRVNLDEALREKIEEAFENPAKP